MNTEVLLKSMISELFGDLRDPGIIWQILVLGLCVLVARWASRWTVTRWEALRREAEQRAEAEAAARKAQEQAALDAERAATEAADRAASDRATPADPSSDPTDQPTDRRADPMTTARVDAGVDTQLDAGVDTQLDPGPAARGDPSSDPPGPRSRSSRLGLQAREGLNRVLTPAYLLAAVLTCRAVLAHFQSVHLLNLAAVLILAGGVVRLVVYVISTVSRSPMLVAFEKVLVTIVWTMVGLYVTGLSKDAIALLSSVQFAVGTQTLNLWIVISSLFWILLILLVAVWAGGLVQARLLSSTTLDPSLRAVLSRLIQTVFLVVAVLISFSVVGIDLTALSVFGGALGVGIGLGLQRIASNYISGFIVLLERQIRLGDQIRIEGVLQGTVRGIRTRFSLVEAGNGAMHILPNETLTSSVVQNLTRPGILRTTLPLRIDVDSDLDVAARTALAVAEAHPRVLKSPGPAIALANFSGDGISLELSFSVADPSKGPGNVPSEIGRAILARYREVGVALPITRREVEITGGGTVSTTDQMAGKSKQLPSDPSQSSPSGGIQE